MLDQTLLELIGDALSAVKPITPTGAIGDAAYRTYLERRGQWEEDVIAIASAIPPDADYKRNRELFLRAAELHQSTV